MIKLQMRRRAILAAAPGVLVAPYVARAQSTGQVGKPEKTKVVLAVGGKSALYYLSLTIAETKGFFKEAGLDVEINDHCFRSYRPDPPHRCGYLRVPCRAVP